MSDKAIIRSNKQVLFMSHWDNSRWLWEKHSLPAKWSTTIEGLPEKRCTVCGGYVRVGKRGDMLGTLKVSCTIQKPEGVSIDIK